MIVATAGHVDHGKTLLIHNLTGVDTDRLPEEKSRGLTIDLGFAYHDFADGRRIGFVDVPGHERFVHNMLAGVSVIDLALLVVAADDGPMPQTAEHLAILDLLGIRRGLVALTKIDRAAPARVAEVTGAIEALLADSSLAGAPIFEIDNLSGAGIDALKERLQAEAADVAARQTTGNFRLAIDRNFTVAGAGLVVTGAVFSGAVAVGDQLLLSPAGVPVRVRGVRAQNQEADRGRAGERCAVNIAGPDLRNVTVHRGDWLVAPPAHAPRRRIDARLTVLKNEAKPLAHWTPVHLHLGAADVTGRVAVLQDEAVQPGEQALVQLVLEHEIGAMRGDRFVLRDQSAQRTIAGGEIIDLFPPSRGRARPERLKQLAAMARATAADALTGLLADAERGVNLNNLATAWNLTPADAEALWAAVPLARFDGPDGPLGLAPERMDAAQAAILEALAAWHEKRPDSLGPNERELRAGLTRTMPAPLFAAALAALTRQRKLARQGMSLKLPDHKASLSAQDESLWRKVAPILEANGGLRPPRVREVAEELGVAPEPMLAFFTRATLLGLALPVAPNRFFLPETVVELAEIAEEVAATAPEGLFSAAAYRDATGIGRNLTIELLEFFDRTGFTQRRGNERRVVKTAREAYPTGA